MATQSNTANPALTERQPGGVIDFDRDYQGLDARLIWRWPLAGARTLQLVAGAAADSTREDRRGFENFIGAADVRLLGVTGRLRRDEQNRANSRDVYAQIEAEFARSVFTDPAMSLEIDMSALMRGDAETRWQSHKIAVDAGILDADEVREIEGFNPRGQREPVV